MTNKIISDFKKKYSELQARIEEAKQAAQRESQAVVASIFEDYFKKYGELVYAIHWTQYTPHFNDGEECVFRVNDINIAFTEEGYDDGEDESSIFGRKSTYEEYLQKWLEYEKDPQAAYQRYVEKFKETYRWSSYYQPDPFERWEPSHYSKQELIDKLEWLAQNEDKYREALDDFEAIKSVLDSIDGDYMKMIYDDHVRVTYFGPDGRREIDEYSHD